MRIVETIKLLLVTKKKISDMQRTLTDPEETEFIIVTIPEAMGIFETKRLLQELRSLRIPSEYIIINKVIPLSAVSARPREKNRRNIKEISGLFTESAITEMPMLPSEKGN
jgi:anion-transporting  ArsA/GET3 family ATPase